MICTSCSIDKPWDDFYKDPSKPSGYSTQCKACKCAKVAEYRQKNPEKVRAAKLAWKKTPQGKKTDKEWRDRNNERLNERNRENYALNKDHKKEVADAWRQRNPEKEKARYTRANVKKRQRIDAMSVHDLTAEQWHEILVTYKFRCIYCGQKSKNLEQDHLTPLSKGGNHTAQNIVPACRSCNAKKNDKNVPIPVQPVLLTEAVPLPIIKRGPRKKHNEPVTFPAPDPVPVPAPAPATATVSGPAPVPGAAPHAPS